MRPRRPDGRDRRRWGGHRRRRPGRDGGESDAGQGGTTRGYEWTRARFRWADTYATDGGRGQAAPGESYLRSTDTVASRSRSGRGGGARGSRGRDGGRATPAGRDRTTKSSTSTVTVSAPSTARQTLHAVVVGRRPGGQRHRAPVPAPEVESRHRREPYRTGQVRPVRHRHGGRLPGAVDGRPVRAADRGVVPDGGPVGAVRRGAVAGRRSPSAWWPPASPPGGRRPAPPGGRRPAPPGGRRPAPRGGRECASRTARAGCRRAAAAAATARSSSPSSPAARLHASRPDGPGQLGHPTSGRTRRSGGVPAQRRAEGHAAAGVPARRRGIERRHHQHLSGAARPGCWLPSSDDPPPADEPVGR